ncbi:MAG: hypothetical protein M3A44_06385 [Gammaproteobacteria bacterium]
MIVQIKNTWAGIALLFSLVLGGMLSMVSTTAQATPAFARSTGAACNKCHSVSFPRLNEKGERFMRNGFQMPGSSEEQAVTGIEGEDKSKDGEEKKKVADDLFLGRISEIFSVTGNLSLLEKTGDSNKKTIGQPTKLTLLATGTIAKDVPIWAELEHSPDGVVEMDRYFIGKTNFNDTTLLNARVGSLDPTTWTSFYGNGAGIDSLVPKIASYSNDGKDRGFTPVGSGYDPRSAIEYYGYNDQFIWAAALANPKTDPDNKNKLDYWLMGRWDILKKNSVSLLYYDDRNTNVKMYTVAGNWRFDPVDVRAQYSRDNSGNDAHGNVTGFALQGDYKIQRGWMAMARFDRTDNGYSSSAIESQMTGGLVYAPYQNIKLTAAYVKELQKAGVEGAAPVSSKKMDYASVRLFFAF